MSKLIRQICILVLITIMSPLASFAEMVELTQNEAPFEIPTISPVKIGRLYQLLKVIDIVCRKKRIPYWAFYGVALGAYRHGGAIPWDDDGDILIKERDITKLVSALGEFQKFNRNITMNWSHGGTILRIHYHTKGEKIAATVDVFILTRDDAIKGEAVWRLLGPVYNWGNHTVRFKKNELAYPNKMRYGPIYLNFPSGGIKELNHRYGDDCMTHAVIWNHEFGKSHKKYHLKLTDLSPASYKNTKEIIDLH